VVTRAWLLAFGVGAASFLLERPAAGRGCTETSAVVGERQCSAYGDDWSVERRLPFVYRFGFRYAEFSTSGRTFSDQPPKRKPAGYQAYDFAGDQLGASRLATGGFDGGLTLHVWGQLYLGFDMGFTWGATDTGTIKTQTSTPLTLRDREGIDTYVIHAGVPVGYRLPLGRVSLRPEVIFGGVFANVSHALEGGTSQTSASVASRALVEPRVAVDVWLTQHFTLSAYGGINAVDPRSRAFGLMLSWHARAFDGDFALW
jgi:hypothetical protein